MWVWWTSYIGYYTDMPIPMQSMRCRKLCVEKDVGFSSDITWVLRPPAGGIPAASPQKENATTYTMRSFVHCRLFTPNFRKFGSRVHCGRSAWYRIQVSIPTIMSTYVSLDGERKRKRKQCLESRETRSVYRNFHLILMKGTRQMGVYCVPSYEDKCGCNSASHQVCRGLCIVKSKRHNDRKK